MNRRATLVVGLLACLQLGVVDAGISSKAPRQVLSKAGRSAVAATGDFGKRIGTSIKDELDTDGDGEVSVEELESAFARLRRRILNVSVRVRRLFERQRNLCLAVGGLAGLAYGRHLAHTILFLQVFHSSGWPLARAGVQRAVVAYEAAKARMPRDTSKAAPPHLRERFEKLSAEVR
eukprot:4882060-Prymnesium_polylepis.1